MGVVVDTSEWIWIERSSEPGDQHLLASLPSDGLIAAISISELRIGALMAQTERQRLRRDQHLAAIIERFVIAPFGQAEALEHALLTVSLRRAGTPIGERDLQIAATALAGGHQVLTRNVRDFERVPGLKLYRA